MTDLEIYTEVWEHPDGKEYQLAIIRDRHNKMGPCFIIRNWGKSIDPGFGAGQIQATYWATYNETCDDFNAEDSKRSKRGYARAHHRETKWGIVDSGQTANLMAKSSYDPGVFGQAPVNFTPQYDVNGNPIQQPPFVPAAPKVAKKVDPDEVPGPRTGGVKRLEWVMAHTDHPQAFDQMMQVASQMAVERDKAAATVASIENDLTFVNAWLHQQMVQQITSQS